MAEQGRLVVLAGNPNVGKSTIFNALTGGRQHTGNWAGKTVGSAAGEFTVRGQRFRLADVPGCYSLMARSEEERVARDVICFGGAAAAIVVCDATCLSRNLPLALQIMETGLPVVVCVNLLDEARKKQIEVDLYTLERRLGVPVVGTTARSGCGLQKLENAVAQQAERPHRAWDIAYPPHIEDALRQRCAKNNLTRWQAARSMDAENSFRQTIENRFGCALPPALGEAEQDTMAAAFVEQAAALCADVVRRTAQSDRRDRRLDRLFTGRYTAVPIMLLLLFFIFWITVQGANIPSQWLSAVLLGWEAPLAQGLRWLGLPPWAVQALAGGAYRVMAWVVSVMLPPMAIFFPLFALLEDYGYLPRVAYNLDRCFCGCCACGKQALTMCAGLGCNAVGVTGCRIIDSPRERLIAIITNSFMPCNGRLPMMLTLISLFLAGGGTAAGAALLVGVIVLGVGVTLVCSALLGKTVLRGTPSSFVLELPPYRRPQLGQVLVRSLWDRTLRVLGRAVKASAPAGLLIWALAHCSVGGETLLRQLTLALDPIGRFLGMDGVIVTGFLLGWPANEIVVPIIAMAYLAQGGLQQLGTPALFELFTSNGWTVQTAVCVILFSLMHWPCATTCMTVRQETGSLRWTMLSLLLPTACGVLCCRVAVWLFAVFA